MLEPLRRAVWISNKNQRRTYRRPLPQRVPSALPWMPDTNHSSYTGIESMYKYQAKSSAQICVLVNYVLTRNDCIKCYIALFKEIIFQQLDAFQTEFQGSLILLLHLSDYLTNGLTNAIRHQFAMVAA